MNPAPPASAANSERWPGLASFTETMRRRFHGRAEVAAELLRQVRRDSFSVLFGQSGHGKTSLLQAGLFPLLRREEFLPVFVRIEHRAPLSPVEQMEAALLAAAAQAGVTVPERRAEDTLWEHLHRPDADFWSPAQEWLTPVFIIDQFEEIFTLSAEQPDAVQRRQEFLDALSDLGSNAIPQALRLKLESDPERHAAYDLKRTPCRILICLREDFLAELESLRPGFRSVMRSRLRLQGLDGLQALEAVNGPGEGILEDGVAERIVKFVANVPASGGDEAAGPDWWKRLQVEPALLSVVCRELDLRRQEQGLEKISAALLEGSHQEILADFYRKSLDGLPGVVRTFIEDELLTKSGHRDSRAFEDAATRSGVSREDLMKLVERRLLHLEDRAGTTRIELTHDLLTSVIRRSRDLRREQEEKEKAAAREQELRSRLRRSRNVAGAFALLSLLAVAAAVWALVMRKEARHQEAKARQSSEDAEKLVAFMTRPLHELTETYGRLDALRATEKEIEGYFARQGGIENRSVESILIEVRFLVKRAESAYLQGQRGRAEAAESRALELARELAARTESRAGLEASAAAGWQVAQSLLRSGRLSQAAEVVDQRLAALGAAPPEDSEIRLARARLLNVKGRILGELRNYKEARQLFAEAGREWRRLAVENPESREIQADAVLEDFWLGASFQAEGRFADARPHFESYRRTCESLAEAHPADALWKREAAIANHRLGEIIDHGGAPNAAQPFYARHRRIIEGLLAADGNNADWQREMALADLGENHDLRRRAMALADAAERRPLMEAALHAIDESLSRIRNLSQRDPLRLTWKTDLLPMHRARGETFLDLGRKDEAAAAFTEELSAAFDLLDADPESSTGRDSLAKGWKWLVDSQKGTGKAAAGCRTWLRRLSGSAWRESLYGQTAEAITSVVIAATGDAPAGDAAPLLDEALAVLPAGTNLDAVTRSGIKQRLEEAKAALPPRNP